MSNRFSFSEPILKSVVGGVSALDMPRLNIKTAKEASEFLKGYGFDFENESDQKKLWYFHRRALVFLEEKLGFTAQEIPEILRDSKQLGDIRQLLLLASGTQPVDREMQRWSCAILRVMHVFVHSENDLFSSFSEEIQKQILPAFQQSISHSSSGAIVLQKNDNKSEDPIVLSGFEVKPFKTSTSTVIKLLAKPTALAMSVYDKLGVRFITNSMFDTYRVVRFLVDESLISFPHIIPEQSSNTIYPADLFFKVITEMQELNNTNKKMSDEEVDLYLRQKLEANKDSVEFLKKENNFSGVDYKFIKFICRKLIHVNLPGSKNQFSFFFPYEVQIMDKESHHKILSGPAEHEAYKERQKSAAKKRVLPESHDLI